jgi:hypothetical protein
MFCHVLYRSRLKLPQGCYCPTTGRQPGSSSGTAGLADPLCWAGTARLNADRNIRPLPCPRCPRCRAKHAPPPAQVGEDANSSMLREALDGSGVGIDHLRAVEGPSGTAVILVQPSGENSILIVGEAGASTPLGSSIFPRTRLPPSDASSCPRFDTLMRCVRVSRWCQHCKVGVCRRDTAGAAL